MYIARDTIRELQEQINETYEILSTEYKDEKIERLSDAELITLFNTLNQTISVLLEANKRRGV